jgi:cation diffusion facilitator CzcD-associated flavoprotein CzcO
VIGAGISGLIAARKLQYAALAKLFLDAMLIIKFAVIWDSK